MAALIAGGDSFEDMLALIPPAVLAKPIAKVEAEMKRPRGTSAQHAALALLFRQAFVELAERSGDAEEGGEESREEGGEEDREEPAQGCQALTRYRRLAACRPRW